MLLEEDCRYIIDFCYAVVYNGGSRGGARERAHPRLRKLFDVQTIFKHVSMCVRNLLSACIDASAAVQRLCPYNYAMCMCSVAMYISHVYVA